MHATLCDFLLDIVQNSIEADATVIRVNIEETGKIIFFSVEDNGKGMSKEVQEKVLDPFHTDGKKHIRRKVGLGLPFLVQAIELTNGAFSLASTEGIGTTIQFQFPLDHIDCPPVGEFASTCRCLLSYPGEHELEIVRTYSTSSGTDGYECKRSELIEALGDITSSTSLQLLLEYLKSQEKELEELRTRV